MPSFPGPFLGSVKVCPDRQAGRLTMIRVSHAGVDGANSSLQRAYGGRFVGSIGARGIPSTRALEVRRATRRTSPTQPLDPRSMGCYGRQVTHQFPSGTTTSYLPRAYWRANVPSSIPLQKRQNPSHKQQPNGIELGTRMKATTEEAGKEQLSKLDQKPHVSLKGGELPPGHFRHAGLRGKEIPEEMAIG